MNRSDHLRGEGLARLVDESPSDEERAHLERCGDCAAELAALREQTASLGELPAHPPPESAWDLLEVRLTGERLMTGARSDPPDPFPSWMNVAAALVLFLGGTAVGSILTHRASLIDVPPSAVDALLDSSDLTLEEAEDYVRRTQEMQLAALFLYRDLVERAGGSAVGDPLMRVALYDHVLAATEAAIREAPADPFLNGLFVNTVAERQIALDQLSLASRELR